jgi:site-specific DNA recombinase
VKNARDHLLLTIAKPGVATDVDSPSAEIRIPWPTKARDSTVAVESDDEAEVAHNEFLIQSVVRAQAWIQSLRDGTYESIEKLAEATRLHLKVVRQALRLAFLSPDITSAILEGRQPAALSLAQIPKLLPLPWTDHRRLLG